MSAINLSHRTMSSFEMRSLSQTNTTPPISSMRGLAPPTGHVRDTPPHVELHLQLENSVHRMLRSLTVECYML